MYLSRTRKHIWLGLAALLLPVIAAYGQPAAPTESPAASPATGASPAASPAETEESPGASPAETEESPAASPAASPAETEESPSPSPADTGASPSPAAGTDDGGDKVLRIHQPTYPDVFDPQKSSFTSEIVILSQNYEGLTKLNAELESVPAAAESWEASEAGDVYTFTLRSGLQYSDGSPLTSENFRYAIERTCDSATAGEYRSILWEIVGCEEFSTTPATDTQAYEAAREGLGVSTPDEQTLVVELTNPAPYFPYIAGTWVMYPAKQELIEEGGENWWQQAQYHVGNGPFQITNISEDQLITFEANENYWEGRPTVDGIEYVYQGDSAIALQAYESGQLDIMQPDPSQLPALQGGPLADQLLIYPSASTYILNFNLTREPFTDQKVREAFSHAIDRQTYCEVIRNGDCVPTLTWIPEGIPGHVPSDQFGFDPEAARQALAESSYGGPEGLPEITLTYNSDDPAAQPRVEYLAGQFRENLGVNVTLDPVDGTTLIELRKNSETFPQMLAFGGWIQDYPDPQNWLSVYWKCETTFARRVGYCNEELDEILNQADVEPDQERRLELYQQAGELLINDVPAPFVYHLANVYLVKPEVTGCETTPGDVEWPGQWASPLTIDINR